MAQQEFASERKYGYPFGFGLPFEPNLPSQLVGKPDSKVADFLGFITGCPVVGRLKEERTPAAMRIRYSEIAEAFNFGVAKARIGNSEIATQLMSVTDRVDGEEVGIYESCCVPRSYLKKMYPLNRPQGYALGRMIPLFVPTQEDGLAIVDVKLKNAAKYAKDDLIFIVLFGDSFVNPVRNSKVDPRKILGCMLAQAVKDEQNCIGILEGLANRIDAYAPNLKRVLVNLSDEDREEFKIVDFSSRTSKVGS